MRTLWAILFPNWTSWSARTSTDLRKFRSVTKNSRPKKWRDSWRRKSGAKFKSRPRTFSRTRRKKTFSSSDCESTGHSTPIPLTNTFLFGSFIVLTWRWFYVAKHSCPFYYDFSILVKRNFIFHWLWKLNFFLEIYHLNIFLFAWILFIFWLNDVIYIILNTTKTNRLFFIKEITNL